MSTHHVRTRRTSADPVLLFAAERQYALLDDAELRRRRRLARAGHRRGFRWTGTRYTDPAA